MPARLFRSAPRAAAVLLLLTACDRGAPAGELAGAGAAAAGADALAPGAPVALPSPAGPGSGEPNLAVAPDGRVYLSWLERQADASHALRMASLAAGDSSWSAPRTVVAARDLFVNWADFPSLLPLGDGQLVAHWLQRNGGGRAAYDVRLARSTDDGATWSPAVTPHDDGTATEHGFVSLWPEGDAVRALWLDGRNYAGVAGGHDGHGAPGAEMTLRTARYTADGAILDGQELDGRVCDCCQTSVALTALGPIAAYRDRSPDEVRDIAVVRHVDGAWTAPAPVHADGWTIAACPVNGPSVAARGMRAAAAWFTAAHDTARVRLAFSGDAGATWAAPIEVDAGAPVGRVATALLDDGSALVLWLERTGDEGAAVLLRQVRADGTRGEPVTISASSAARSSGFPRLARSGDWLYLAWTDPGADAIVRVARLPLRGAGA